MKAKGKKEKETLHAKETILGFDAHPGEQYAIGAQTCKGLDSFCYATQRHVSGSLSALPAGHELYHLYLNPLG